MMMRLLQAESAAGLNLFFTPLSCHRVGCGLQGTVSRKSSSSPFYFKAKQRKNTPTRVGSKIALRSPTEKSEVLFPRDGKAFGWRRCSDGKKFSPGLANCSFYLITS